MFLIIIQVKKKKKKKERVNMEICYIKSNNLFYDEDN